MSHVSTGHRLTGSRHFAMDMPQVAPQLGDLLRQHRFRAGLSQGDLARQAGVSVRAVRYIEQGRVARPHASSVRQLASALGLSDPDCDALLGAVDAARPGRPRADEPPASWSGPDPQPPAALRVDVLGPLAVRRDGAVVEIESPMVRGLLGLLAIQHGQVVTGEEIVDVLWGDRPPRTCPELVHTYVAQVRTLLEPGRQRRAPARLLKRTRGGYRLELGADGLDLAEFDGLAARAVQHPGAAAWDLYTRAWGCWRGPVLAGAQPRLRHHPAATAIAQRRVALVVGHADLALQLGRCDQVLDPLRAALAEEPLHEVLAARLMLALAGSGQQAAALELFETVRARLDTELGVDPGGELQDAHVRVLRQQVPVTGCRALTGEQGTGDPAPPSPAQLPPDVAAFTGRDAYLHQLDALRPDLAGNAPRVVMISTIAGMGGVGKTALAVHWAHRVRDRFPDGQLHVNLRGHATGPALRPIDALAGFLRSFGVPADQVPDDVDQATALYRSHLAGKRVLVLLDNAASAEQVRPLLPADPGCLVLVTGRHRLAGLVARDGARQLALGVLTSGEALALLRRVLGDERVSAEPAAAADLARLCAHLPLALRIAAANLSVRPRQRIADYVAKLSNGDRIGALAVDGDPESAVRAAFDLSYGALSAPEERMFRLLGLVPGPDFSAEAAAALAGCRPAEAETVLDRLSAKHLVDDSADGRYSMHDLLRLYAAELSAEDGEAGRRASTGRLAGYYVDGVEGAAHLLYPHLLHLRPPEQSPHLVDRGRALAWLDTERANLVAAVTQLPAFGHRAAAWTLADFLQGYFRLRANAVDWQTVATAALGAAEAAGDRRAQAAIRLSLGSLHDFQSRYREAAVHYAAALAVARDTGWTDGEAVTLNNLSRIHWVAGQAEQTIDHLKQALALHRRTGRVAGQAVTLANLGVVHWELGRPHRSLDALDLPRSGGAGGAVEPAGRESRLRRAIGYLDEALALHRGIGDRRNEADTLRVLAAAHRDAGRHDTALDLAEAALALARATEERRFEVPALSTLATVHARLGHRDGAYDHHHRALALAREIGDRQQEGQALVDLADSAARLGERDQALVHAHDALALAREIEARLLERQARDVLAAVRRHRARPVAAGHITH
jgi:DNA-binding SARP family transcriptional activator/tetratricopeptide (TPR) repeat protein/transcriptional regulator with XRE-family HTH domain